MGYGLTGCFEKRLGGAALVYRRLDKGSGDDFDAQVEAGASDDEEEEYDIGVSKVHTDDYVFQAAGACGGCAEKIQAIVDAKTSRLQRTAAALDAQFPDGRHAIADHVLAFLFFSRPSCWECKRPPF